LDIKPITNVAWCWTGASDHLPIFTILYPISNKPKSDRLPAWIASSKEYHDNLEKFVARAGGLSDDPSQAVIEVKQAMTRVAHTMIRAVKYKTPTNAREKFYLAMKVYRFLRMGEIRHVNSIASYYADVDACCCNGMPQPGLLHELITSLVHEQSEIIIADSQDQHKPIPNVNGFSRLLSLWSIKHRRFSITNIAESNGKQSDSMGRRFFEQGYGHGCC
jgi:hypothetical protein